MTISTEISHGIPTPPIIVVLSLHRHTISSSITPEAASVQVAVLVSPATAVFVIFS